MKSLVEHMGGGTYVVESSSAEATIRDEVRARHASAIATPMDQVEAEIVAENNNVYTLQAEP